MDNNGPERLRVLFIIDFIAARVGGTENQVLKTIGRLDRERYDLHLLALRDTEWIRKHGPELECPVSVLHVVKFKNPVHLGNLLRMIPEIRRVAPDVVMTFFPVSNIWGVLFARLAGVRTIYSTRRDFGLWLARRDTPLLKVANRCVSGIVTNSEQVKELTAREEGVPRERLRVIHNGIELDEAPVPEDEEDDVRERYGIEAGSRVVGIVGGLKPMKRHATFLKAARLVLAEEPDLVFVMVGDGPLRAELEALSRSLGVADKVRFVGSQDNVFRFLRVFDVAVNCSANEGLSNAVMEYMACELPCVVADAGGNPALIRDGLDGLLFELDNEQELAARVLEVLRDEQRRDDLSRRAKARVLKEFSIEKMCRAYDALFSECARDARKEGI